jgi:1,2-diacylglycerol 3-beta-galactosyltransferase
LGFRAANTRVVARVGPWFFRLLAGYKLRKFLCEYSPDLVVAVHPLFTTFPRQVLRETGSRAPFVTIVTDLFDAHILWFDRKTDLCVVATEGARDAARRYGMPEDSLRIVGLPVSLSFLVDGRSKAEHRAALGLALDQTTVLLGGGGEGMGPLYEIARAIAQARLPIQLVVIAGRNAALRKRLEATAWEIPVCVQGFVTNMPDWMHASDLIITKAGPSTITEALACALPIFLSGFLPGQETGNVTFVEQSGVGVLRKSPEEIAHTLGEWLMAGNDTLVRFAARAREVARPRAALEIARILDGLCNAT